MFNNIYQGKKVFITGHTGFKGSWLALWLTQLGAEVTGYSLDLPSQPNHFELLQSPVHLIMGNILDKAKLRSALQACQPDIVFHLAAQALVLESYSDPVKTFETNVIGTANVLESCRMLGTVKAIVNVTSDKCYQNNEWERAYVETDAMGGYDPYSASKGCAELVGNSYRNSFFMNSSTLLADARAGNVIGGGDWANNRLIPDLMRATSQQQIAVIRRPQAVRPWQHVLEPLSGYLHLGWKLLNGEKDFADNWNFGPNPEASLTVQEVITSAQQHWDAIQYSIEEASSDLHEAKLLTLDSTKAITQLHWKNIWNSQVTFAKTIEWYKNYYQSGQLQSLQNLSDYIKDAQKIGAEWAIY